MLAVLAGVNVEDVGGELLVAGLVGQVEHDVDEVEAGELIYIPANVPHIGRTLGEEEAIGVEVFAPVRQDYLDMAEHQMSYERGETPAPSQPRPDSVPAE